MARSLPSFLRVLCPSFPAYLFAAFTAYVGTFLTSLFLPPAEVCGRGRAAGECSICLCEIGRKAEADATGCGHVFHRPCLRRWVNSRGRSCPLCREDLVAAGASVKTGEGGGGSGSTIVFCPFAESKSRDAYWIR